MKSKEIIQQKYKNVICPKCNSNQTKKDGKRKTQNRGKIQRYRCKECDFRFVIDDGFYRMRNNENKVTAGIDLYYKGVSLRKVQEHFQAFYPHNSSHMSVYRWIVKYAEMVGNLVDNIPIKCGKEMQSEEMEYMRSRTNENLIKVMKRAKFKTGEQVEIVTTDGLRGYPRVLRKTFSLQSPYHASSRTKSKIIHNVVIADERGFNYPIERLHNTIRERTKVMRGFHGCLESARAIMKGLEINYNFNRKHMALGNKTPSQIAIPKLELGINKWLDLIKMSKV